MVAAYITWAVVWLAGIGFVINQYSRVLGYLMLVPQRARQIGSLLGFGSALIILLGGMFGIQSLGGIRGGTITWWAVIAVAVLGLMFIGIQVVSALAIMSLFAQETDGPGGTSEPRETIEARCDD